MGASRMSDPIAPHLAAVPDPPAPTQVGADGSEPPSTGEPAARPRVKKLRLLAVLVPLAILAVVSTVFGMMMAVASDLPALEQLPQVAKRKNSVLLDVNGRQLATLTSNQGRIIVSSDQIAPYAKYAVIAIEDRRFYQNSGVDLKGIARAFVQDIVQGRQAQGGSTIAQQFVKNALQAQAHRTVFEKLREAALAYHMTRKWSKERILTEYLNSVYFGNGAYGIEAAARTYFGADPNHAGCGTAGHPMCASELTPAEAALLAGIIASPSGYDPVAHPQAATRRRNIVLQKMLEQGRIRRDEYRDALTQNLYYKLSPPKLDTRPGTEYFVSWVRQSLVDQVGPQRAFEGNLRVRTTLDVQLQQAAQQAVNTYLSWPQGPTASLVAIDNETGEVRAMIGGRDYAKTPFNLATQGQRQPGSAIKPFILAEALRQGISPNAVYPSRKRVFQTRRPGGGHDVFVVNNFDNEYFGSSTLANGLTHSDNAVFAALGLQVGTKKVARLAERMGIRTPISTNDAMTLGGLSEGVTPLDMAHAYETFAAHGRRVTGTLGTSDDGPVGIREIDRVASNGDLKTVKRDKPVFKPVLPRALADEETQLLTGPVRFGTATAAQYGGFAAGKTGTTENSGDAWFVGFTPRWTIAVWVGYPNGLKPMLTEFRGRPVTGGTFPALIWRDFVVAANAIVDGRINRQRERQGLAPLPTASSVTPAPTTVAPATTTPAPSTGTSTVGATTGTTSPGAAEAPATSTPAATPPPSPAPTPTPSTTPAPSPTPTPAPPPTTGGGGTTGGTGGGVAAPTG